MDIAKIIKLDDFIKVAQAYSEQVKNPQASSSLLNEMKQKLESYINKQIVKLNKEAMKKEEKMSDLIDLLMSIDRDIPYQSFFKLTDLEIFTNLFKLTFYQKEYAVINHEQEVSKEQDDNNDDDGFLGLKILDHEFVNAKVDSIADSQAKCNFIVNNLLVKLLYYSDHQKLLIQVAELMYSQDVIKSTQKVGKLLIYFGKLFEVVKEDRPKYMCGSLFALGGYLKLETKSYLMTLEQKRQGFEQVCPLFSDESEYDKQEKQRARILDQYDQHYFENDLIQVIIQFVRSVVKQSKGVINNEIWNYYLDFTHEKFIDEYEEERHKNRDKLYSIESAHYVVSFLFDLIQFIFQFMVMAEEVDEVKEESKAMEVDTQAPQMRNIFDHRKPIVGSELVSLRYKYFFDKMEMVIYEIFKGIKDICPNEQHLLWFWQVKNAEVQKKWDDFDEQRDSYDRQDNYNVHGLAVYLFLTAKTAICQLTNSDFLLDEIPFAKIGSYSSPMSNVFQFECLMPLINYTIRSKSKTLSAIGFEAAAFWTFVSQQEQAVYDDLGHFTKDDQSIQFMLQTIFVNMGGHTVSQKSQRLSMKIFFQCLKLYSATAKTRIFNYIVQILDDEKNDRAISILISQYYKYFCDSDPQVFFENTKEIFEITLDCMKEDQYILELTERLQASLNLYIYLVLRETNLIKQGLLEKGIITEHKYQDDKIKKYLESLAHTIQAGFSSLDEEEQKLSTQSQDEQIKQGMIDQINAKRNSLTMLQAILTQANSL